VSKEMRKRIQRALADENLQNALKLRMNSDIRAFLRLTMAEVDFDTLSKGLRSVKERCIDNLPELLKQFKEEAARAGTVVYEAKDAVDANNYVLKVAQEHNVKHIVKSKSMLTEEIELREHLEDVGIVVKETDIGEWIVQLAGERPAHLVGPAIHKTIEQVAELFSKETGQELVPDPTLLLNVARDTLRDSYINADMGISGANIAVAETGSVVIVTNEGNGCMSTTLPPVYVALVGYEKIVATLEDTTAVLRLLSRSTMGMKMPVYISYISGPSRTNAISEEMELGGQDSTEFHIVLVDNGRQQMRESDDFKEALYCIKCGACLNTCPVFGSVAGQTYGYIYQGGIGAILTAFLHGMDKAVDQASLCMGCRACRDVCPVRIDIPHMITLLKTKMVAEGGLSWREKVAYRGILEHPKRLRKAMKFASYLQAPFTDEDAMIKRLPYPLNAVTQTISLPALSRQTLHDSLKESASSKVREHPTVAFFAGCVTDYAYPNIGHDVMKVLREYGAEPYFPAEQTCCGAPAFYAGDVETALSLAKVNITAIERDNPDYIVTVCPGCAVMLKQEYLGLTAHEPEWHRRAQAISGKVRDFSQLILELNPVSEKKPPRNRKITYHDPCHLKRGLGIDSEPRVLLEHEGFELVEMVDSDACCGFGGETLLNYPELSNSVLQRKLDNIEATGADTVITNCVPCILQIRGGLDKRHSNIKVMHTAELLAR